jgi:L-ribulose-5-phosphate 3-epimerase
MNLSMVGVCSWSLQVKNISELNGFTNKLGIQNVQIACGDPHHASWDEGDDMPIKAKNASFKLTGAMLGFSGEDYTTPQTIEKTGGFGDPLSRPERLERFKWSLLRVQDLEVNDIMFHAGFIPPINNAGRKSFLQTLETVSTLANNIGVNVSFETGQESSELLFTTLKELDRSNLYVNFDPANMLLYDQGNPIEAVEMLGKYIRSVHLKDANRPKIKGQWGEEVALGKGEVNIPLFLKTLKKSGYSGPMSIEREVGSQQDRFNDILQAVEYLRELDV